LVIYTDFVATADARNVGTAQIIRKRFLAKAQADVGERTPALLQAVAKAAGVSERLAGAGEERGLQLLEGSGTGFVEAAGK
jgi:hypothetical protein